MSAPTISITRSAMRQRISRRLDDLVLGTATGGSTTTMTATGDIARYPTSPKYLVGSELTLVNSGTSETRFVTDHSISGATVTLTFNAMTTGGVNAYTFELHKLDGRGFTKAQYDDAINAAVDSLADAYFTDTDNTLWAIQRGAFGPIGAVTSSGIAPRHEYPMPSGYNYIYALDYLDAGYSTGNPLVTMDTYTSFGKTTGPTRLAQGFKVPQTGFYEYVVISMRSQGTNIDNAVLSINTDSSGVASPATYVQDGNATASSAGSAMETAIQNIVFRFNPAVFLQANTQYHWTMGRSGSLNNSNYYELATDTGNTYSDGVAQTYSPSTYTKITTSTLGDTDFCFAVFRQSTGWIELRQKRSGMDGWEYRRVGTDVLFLPRLPRDMTPVRIRGLAPIAEPTTETSALQVRPEYIEAFSVDFLLSGRAGTRMPDNYAQGAAAWAQQIIQRPRPIRMLPPNSIKVYA